jgi:hypothetical protein
MCDIKNPEQRQAEQLIININGAIPSTWLIMININGAITSTWLVMININGVITSTKVKKI